MPKKRLFASIVLAGLLLQLPLPALALTKQVSGSEVVDKRHYPVIFIHGAAGSELDGAGGNYWPGTLWPTDTSFDKLALTPDGKKAADGGPGLWPTRVMRHGAGWEVDNFPDLTFASVYNGYYNYMEKEGFPYGKPGADGKVLYDFVYDWRFDNHLWTKNLDQKVDAVLKETKADKVILMGHSMGSLQIRLYMKDPKRAAKVGGVVFMGGPQHGATQVFWALTEGYNFGNRKVSNPKMWQIMQNWEAGYQLLPDWPVVRDKKTKRMWTLDEMYGDGFIPGEAYRTYKVMSETTPLPYGLPNAAFRKTVVPFHQELGDSATPYGGKYWLIRGDKVKTLQMLDATLVDVGLDRPLLKLERIESTDGDGTVPGKGYELGGVDEAIVVPGAEHGDIPSNAQTQVHLTRIRKEINDEEFRQDLADDVMRYAENRLADLQSRKTEDEQEEEPGMVRLFFGMFFGRKDEEKVKARDLLIAYARKTFRTARANVVIAESGGHPTDTVYLSLDSFVVSGHGTGGFVKPTVTARVDSYETFEKIVNHQLDARQAMKSGAVKLDGAGIGNGFKFKILQWVNKYMK
jgi:pimeloyl-ACP methyl ester carboxylesterase